MGTRQLGWIVFFLSAGLVGFELSLMRVLLVASWHHFAFLVISIALLGFGASGTALTLLRKTLLPRVDAAMFALVLATALSMPACLSAAQHVPVEARVIPAILWRQVGCWLLYWALLGVPFLLGATGIGLALMTGGRRVPGIYAANLLGSAAGSIVVTAAMHLVPPQWLSSGTAALVLLGAVLSGLRPHGRLPDTWIRPGLCVACAALIGALCAFDPPRIRMDPYKYGAYVRRLEKQGDAERVGVSYGPRAVVEAWADSADGARPGVFHYLPFLSAHTDSASAATIPPPMAVLVADGHMMGSVLNVARAQDARVTDQTMMAFPYALLEEVGSARAKARGPVARPRVLLLGEAGGANVWLAARHAARAIDVVQPDANILALLRGPLRHRGGGVLELPGVEVTTVEPRHFVEQARGVFDLIQLVMLESSAAGSGGVTGLAENHLITIEGIAACLERLSDDGLLVAARGIQTPPRDNLKIAATLIAALRRVGVEHPQRHLVIARDYLAVCTIAKRSAWNPEQIESVRRVCRNRQLTPIWFPGVLPEELNQPDAMQGPPGAGGDWFHYGARQLFSPSAEGFIADWPFNIRPPTDDRPFFLDFCKLGSIAELKQAFGDMWLTRIELGFLVVLAAIVMVGAAGAALTIAPLLILKAHRRGAGRGITLVYFASIGLGYVLLELTFLSRLTRWIGDPVSAAAVTIGGFLVASGLGSMTAQRLEDSAARLLPRIVTALIVVGIAELMGLNALAPRIGSLPYAARCALSFLAIAPLGYLMGFPMPAALVRLNCAAPAALPWAWGVNGFASVVAAPLAVAIGMTWGYSVSGGIALLAYVAPGALFGKLPAGGRTVVPAGLRPALRV